MKHSTEKWITAVVACALLSVLGAGVLYLNLSLLMADYDAYLVCNPGTGISRLEWLLGARPSDDCWR